MKMICFYLTWVQSNLYFKSDVALVGAELYNTSTLYTETAVLHFLSTPVGSGLILLVAGE